MKILIIFAFLASFVSVSAQDVAYIISDTAIIYEKPTIKSTILESRTNGQELAVSPKDLKNGWYRVWRGGGDNDYGWINGNDIAFGKDVLFYSNPVWSKLSETKTTLDGVYFFYNPSKLKKSYGDVETWIMLKPMFPAQYIKANKLPKNYDYTLQYFTISCESERLSISNSVHYSADGLILKSNVQFPTSFYSPIVPNSVGEIIHKKLCR